jgi:hypothetical protein
MAVDFSGFSAPSFPSRFALTARKQPDQEYDPVVVITMATYAFQWFMDVPLLRDPLVVQEIG